MRYPEWVFTAWLNRLDYPGFQSLELQRFTSFLVEPGTAMEYSRFQWDFVASNVYDMKALPSLRR